MSLNVTFSTLNSLGTIGFIGGSNYTLKFNVLNQSGCAIDISSAVCRWKMSPFGTDYAILEKAGNVTATNTFEILLSADDTANFSGKYAHQPIIEFPSGVTFIPAQGILTIVRGIQ